MYKGSLKPFQSTHFRCVETRKDFDGLEWLCSKRLTKGKIYRILSWRKIEHVNLYSFKDDTGKTVEWAGFSGIEDYSFERNLKVILS